MRQFCGLENKMSDQYFTGLSVCKLASTNMNILKLSLFLLSMFMLLNCAQSGRKSDEKKKLFEKGIMMGFLLGCDCDGRGANKPL